MDMQGTPIGSGGEGTKATSDRSGQQDPIQESTGTVAADSLAADSARAGGGFGDNPNSAPSGARGAQSTLANTDTSAATTLDAAPDASAREERAAWGETADLKGPGGVKYGEALGGQPDFPGTTSESGYAGGPSGGSGASSGATGGARASGNAGGSGGSENSGGSYSTATAGGSGSSGNTEGSSSSGAGYGSGSGGASGGGAERGDSGVDRDSAPSYVQSVVQGGDGKPKGRDLHEGGFEGEASNNDAEIGSKDDPGRAAVQSFEERNAASSSGGKGPTQRNLDTETGYDSLKTDEQA